MRGSFAPAAIPTPMRRLPKDPVAFLRARIVMAVVGLTARFGRAPLTAQGGPVVSLTSFDPRLRRAHLTLESIGRGTRKPSRIVLWLDEEVHVTAPIPALARMVQRGLEIRHCDDHGPHKKYQPYAASIETHRLPMITADDDVLYPRTWLASLMAVHERDPDAIVAHRVNRIEVSDGGIRPYSEWSRAEDRRRTPRNYAVGIKGVLYPPAFLDRLRHLGTSFAEVAPGSSDTWLFHVGLLERVPVVPTLSPAGSRVIPLRGGPRSSALMDQNVARGRNDRVRTALMGHDEVRAVVLDDFAHIETPRREPAC